MRFGCCLNMIADKDDPTGITLARHFRDAGYDYIELPLAQISEMSEDEFSSLENDVKASGLPCEVCNNFVPPYVKLVGPDADVQRITAFFELTIGRASRLGAKLAGIGCADARNVPEGFPRDQALAQLRDAFRIAGTIAQRYGIIINIEPLNKKICNLVNEVDEAVALCEAVGHPSVKLLIDYYHLLLDYEPVEHIAQMGGLLTHAHIASLDKRFFPKQGDTDDYSAFFNALRSIGYDDRLSIEAYSGNVAADAKESLAFLRSNF